MRTFMKYQILDEATMLTCSVGLNCSYGQTLSMDQCRDSKGLQTGASREWGMSPNRLLEIPLESFGIHSLIFAHGLAVGVTVTGVEITTTIVQSEWVISLEFPSDQNASSLPSIEKFLLIYGEAMLGIKAGKKRQTRALSGCQESPRKTDATEAPRCL